MSKPILSKANHLYLKRGGRSKNAFWAHKTGALERMPEGFRQECIRAAKEVGAAYAGKKIVIFLSGGLDSHVVAESFRLAKVEFTPLIIQYEDGLNQDDVALALKWCERRKIKPRLVQFNLKRFFSSRYPQEKVRRYQYTMPVYLILMKVMDSLPRGEVAVLGSGEPLLNRQWDEDCLEEVWDELSLFRFAVDRGRPFITHFFFWSPELYFAFITSPEYLEFVRQRGEIYYRSFPLKEKLYRREFKLPERPKRHGLEIALDRYHGLMSRVMAKMKVKSTHFSYRKELEYLTSSLQRATNEKTIRKKKLRKRTDPRSARM